MTAVVLVPSIRLMRGTAADPSQTSLAACACVCHHPKRETTFCILQGLSPAHTHSPLCALRPPRLCQQEGSAPLSQLSGAWLAAGRAVVEDELVRACVGNAPAHQPCHVINVSAPRHILYHVDRDSSERGEEKTLRSATRPQRDGGGLTEARGVAALDGHARDGATRRDRLRRNPTLPTATHASGPVLPEQR